MVQYILSWIPLLEERYNSLVQAFASSIGETIPTTRNDTCFAETNNHFPLAILAMYARFASKNVPKSIIEYMASGIMKEYKNIIKENAWMDKEFKKYAGTEKLSFLHAKERLAYIAKVESFMRLTEERNLKEDFQKFSVMGYVANAYYNARTNGMMIPLPFVQFPLFDITFPRSFTFGSIGHIIGHELSHSLDINGRYFDGDGIPRDWWTDEWSEKYNLHADCYKRRYSKVK
ncbi:hypothetical protein GCK32_015664, partial [Trichostrongylus colubriformis]